MPPRTQKGQKCYCLMMILLDEGFSILPETINEEVLGAMSDWTS